MQKRPSAVVSAKAVEPTPEPSNRFGAFRIGGLVDGEFTLIAMPVARWSPRDLAANASARGGVRAGSSDVALRFPGSMLRGRVVDECGEPIERAGVSIAPLAQRRLDLVTDHDGKFHLDGLVPDRSYAVVATIGGEARRSGRLDDVVAGATDVLVRIDTGPRVVVRVDFGRRRARTPPYVRLARDGEGVPPQRDFRSDRAVLRAAPDGTWRVLAHVGDLDAHGDAVDVWIELGTVRTGDPEKSFVVPR